MSLFSFLSFSLLIQRITNRHTIVSFQSSRLLYGGSRWISGLFLLATFGWGCEGPQEPSIQIDLGIIDKDHGQMDSYTLDQEPEEQIIKDQTSEDVNIEDQTVDETIEDQDFVDQALQLFHHFSGQ